MTTAPWPIAPPSRHNRRSPQLGRGQAKTALGRRGDQRLTKRRLHLPPAARGPGGASDPPRTARSRPGPSGGSCCIPAFLPRGRCCRPSGRAAAPWRSARPVALRSPIGRSRGDRPTSARRWGRSPSWRRTRAPCSPPAPDPPALDRFIAGPKNSTNLFTTPSLRRICVSVSTRSVAVAPGGNWPESSKPITSGASM